VSHSKLPRIVTLIARGLPPLLWAALGVIPVSSAAQSNPAVLAVFAHPDDERVIGPLLSRLGREGRETHLVIATDGSKGVRPHAGIAAGAPLTAARKLEAECAAKRLNVRHLHLLGLEDAGLASFASLGRLRTELATLIARTQPVAIITFGPEGGTGHPDHRLVGNIVTEIVQRPENYQTIDLLYASLPAGRLKDAPRSAPGINGVADELLTVRIPVRDEDLTAARESFACHRTQYTQAEMDALNLTLAYVWNGVSYLRPWNGRVRDPARIFSPK
jgi:LmbE family N-acetylglucosaminyl deacetylase